MPEPKPPVPESKWRPRQELAALATLLTATAVLYLWGLSASGWANDFYAAAVQAGTQSWKALLFGSLDSGNAITVDKPPAAMWVMGLSGRLFGFSSFSMLLPQALMGVGSVALLYSAVRRWSGAGAGLLAGSVLALTPVAALMFRFNNPDALLVLLLVAAAYCTVRATESGSTRWLALAGAAVGFGFLTKMMQAFLVVPAFGLMFLVAAPLTFWSRIRSLLVALAATVISGGWFVALVSLWPSASRPYIGGSTDNSLLELALGYNGLGRVLGGSGNGGGGGGGGNTMFGGSTGITRLFGMSFGTEISWLLPAALIGLIGGLWFTRRTPRTGRIRAALLLWGGWLIVTGIVFSFMKGTVHPYYTVALAPAIAALVAISVRELWRGKQFLSVRITLAAMSAGTGIWNFILLDRTADWFPALRWVILVGSIIVSAVLVVGGHQLRRYTSVLAIAGLLFGLAGTTAYAVETAAHAHTGSIPTSGPATGGMGGMGGGPGRSEGNDAALESLLENTDSRWAAATVGSMTAGPLELSTGTSIMAIGGFTGSDDSPTLVQFEQYVADGQVKYFIAGNGMGGGPGGGSGTSSEISTWVTQHFAAQTVGGSTVYDLSSPTSS
nr:glycosyltransferase family 39 protein [Spelaeibacter cavernicola]